MPQPFGAHPLGRIVEPPRHSFAGRPLDPTFHALTCPALPRSGSLDAPEAALILPDPHRRVRAFATVRELARHIHAERGAEALQLLPERIRFKDAVREAVAVFADDPQGGRRRLIGHAWIGGRDWRALEGALEALMPANAFEGSRA